MLHLWAGLRPSLQSPVSSLQKTHDKIRETGPGNRANTPTAWLATGDWRLGTS
jgi:hypothetical protein